ncbi:MAG: nucleotidyltransferase family protein [Acidobacteriia bacterium]|nr:nucleotidyltransferase family protein [Terriglobia bacterium]
MGQPKALLPFPGRMTSEGPPCTLLEHLLAVVRHPQIGMRRVVLGANADEIRRRVPLEPESVVINHEWQRGQLSSIQVALGSLPVGATDGLLLCPVDHPMITAELVDELVTAFYRSGKLIVIPTFHGRRGHPVIFSSKLYGALLTAPQELGARAVVWEHANEVLEVPTDQQGVILNVNDPETYEQLIRNV